MKILVLCFLVFLLTMRVVIAAGLYDVSMYVSMFRVFGRAVTQSLVKILSKDEAAALETWAARGAEREMLKEPVAFEGVELPRVKAEAIKEMTVKVEELQRIKFEAEAALKKCQELAACALRVKEPANENQAPNGTRNPEENVDHYWEARKRATDRLDEAKKVLHRLQMKVIMS